MSFIVRPVSERDLNDLYDLASQFTLLNLPANRSILSQKIQTSIASFSEDLKKEDAEFLFVVEDTESSHIVGSSIILAKHGTEKVPHSSYKILKKEHFSKGIGVGFIHQILRLTSDTNGPTEIGGLLVDRAYRRRPEKIGRLISLMRFLYMAMYPNRFESRVLCELTAPHTAEGRSEFWEALGRRFTGLPYTEADQISQTNKEFISSLFPQEDIYLSLLDAKARLVVGRVGDHTLPAQHLLEKVGLKYLDEVDPFDGGPHYGAELKDISIVKNLKSYSLAKQNNVQFSKEALIGAEGSEGFRGCYAPYEIQANKIFLPDWAYNDMQLEEDQKIYISHT